MLTGLQGGQESIVLDSDDESAPEKKHRACNVNGDRGKLQPAIRAPTISVQYRGFQPSGGVKRPEDPNRLDLILPAGEALIRWRQQAFTDLGEHPLHEPVLCENQRELVVRLAVMSRPIDAMYVR